MTTELATIDRNDFAALAKDSEIAEALQANLSSGEKMDVGDLTRVPTPTGGSTKWTWEGVSGEESAKEIEGVLVYVQPQGTLWPNEEYTGSDSPPLLVTHDMVHATRVGDDFGDIDPQELDKYRLADGTYDWASLPWNQWDSGKGGIGKRCKESRRLFVLPRNEAWPLVVTAQVGSLKVVRQFIKKLPVPHYRAIVSLGLQKVPSKRGIDYAQIVPRLVGTLDRETGEQVRKTYTLALARVATQLSAERDDFDD